jgi:GT2 family glycosyltransferase
VTYNNLEGPRRLLKSIYKQFDTTKGEVIVVDDGSKQYDISILQTEFKDLKVIRLKDNRGAANARNIGVKNASYDTIFFLDADMELYDNVINEVEKTMQDNKPDAVVGTVSEVPLNRGIFQDYWALLKSYFHSLPIGHSTTFYPMIGIIKKKIFEEVGGFDSRIAGASIEDYEFSFRLTQKGYKVLFNPRILASTSYKDFLTSIKQSINRAKKWSIIFLDRRKFDNHTTTLSQGIGNILGFLIWIFLALSYFNAFILFPTLVLLIVFLYINRKFFTFIFKKRGCIFGIVCIFIYLISSFFITMGSILGALYIFRSKESRKKAVYG